MPTYHVTFEAENFASYRNVFAPTISECIDKVLRSEKGDWVGKVAIIELVKLRN